MNFKNEIPSWDDIRLFLSVARSGGLAGAVGATGASPATLGRRILRLERTLSAELFEKRQTGYSLTPAGEEFLVYALQFEERAVAVERWRQGRAGLAPVRIASGSWTAWFMTQHISKLTSAGSGTVIEFVTGAGYVDLLRREAHIGVRNQRPHQVGLAGRRMASVAFAVYGAEAFRAQVDDGAGWQAFGALPWVGASEIVTPSGANITPWARWVRDVVGARFQVAATDVRLIVDAAASGAGVCVLPCFIGDSMAGLSRLSPLIEEMRHDQWLVSHEEDRHFPAVRRVLDGLYEIFDTARPLFAGESPRA